MYKLTHNPMLYKGEEDGTAPLGFSSFKPKQNQFSLIR